MANPQPEIVNLFPFTRRAIRAMRRESVAFLETIGMAVQNTRDIALFVIKREVGISHVLQQMAFVGIDTLGIAFVLTTFSGMVISLQIAKEMVKQGGANFVGALVSMAMLRELAPIMTGFAVIAMAGSAFAAELSTMKITNQVSALQVLHVNPVRYLLLPRVLAGVLALPMMSVITTTAGIAGGLLVAHFLAGVNAPQYWESVWRQTAFKDVFAMLTKTCVFGYVIAIISTTIGLNTTGGSREVGIATTRAVVWSFILMAIFDYLLTFMFYGSR